MSLFQQLLSLASPEPSGRSLYQKIWELVNDNLFEVDKLDHWARWKHRFDRQIHSYDDAVAYANQALASLGDRYNQVYAQEADRQLYALIHNQYAVTVKELPDQVGYLRLQDFLPWNTCDQIERALCQLQNAYSVVFDLRGNGGGDLEQALDCLAFFLPEGPLVTFKTRIKGAGYVTRQVRLTADSLITVETDLATRTSRQEKTGRRSCLLQGRPLVLLVDKETASAAELFVAAMHDNGSPVVGSPTCGKGIGQQHFSINEELKLSQHQQISLQVTNCRYHSPRGIWLGDGQTEASGITPDLAVEPNQGQFEFGSTEDKQLQTAIHLLSRQPRPGPKPEGGV